MYKIVNGRFISKYDGFQNIDFFTILKWQLSKIGKRKAENYKLEILKEKLPTSSNFISWLGHSTLLIQIDGVRVLTDPVFGDIPFFKRRVEFPYSLEELGKIDYTLISHSHYDHLDLNSLKKLDSKIVAPLNMGKYLKGLDFVELDWFESLPDFPITLLPAKHWGRRTAFDTNRTLWGSYLIRDIYFAGDTSYSDHFLEIGKKFDIKIALMPIGAYKPEKIMRNNHINPKEAVQGSLDLKAEFMIPIHYGTFKLSDEPMAEPLEWARKEAVKVNLKALKIGEVLMIP
jgi:L-ascorbate metabolism protein UlaG (beta-lactamase superfamily)